MFTGISTVDVRLGGISGELFMDATVDATGTHGVIVNMTIKDGRSPRQGDVITVVIPAAAGVKLPVNGLPASNADYKAQTSAFACARDTFARIYTGRCTALRPEALFEKFADIPSGT